MNNDLLESLGWFLYPQLAISVVVVGLCVAYLTAALLGKRRMLAHAPWRRQLDPLASIAVAVGLLGSVWAFTKAFGGFSGGIDVDRIVDGLGTAYTTTGFGLVTAIIAGIGSYVGDLLVRGGPARD